MNRFLLFLFIFCAGWFGSASAQTPEKINLQAEELSAHASLNAGLKKSKLILTGENHSYIRLNRTNELHFLRFLNKEYQVKDYLIEQGYALSEITNRYIHGDTSYRKQMYALTSYPYYILFDSIRILNSSLPADQQVTIHGVDVERTFSSSILLLDKLVPAALPTNDSILLEIETIKSMAARYFFNFDSANYFVDRPIDYYYSSNYRDGRYSYEKYQAVETSLKEVINTFERKKTYYQAYLKSDYAQFEKVIQLLYDYRRWDKYSDDNTLQSYLYREEIIYKNVKTLLAIPGARYYGQFGRMHIARCLQNKDAGYYNYRSFVNRLIEDDTTLQDKITCIALVYEEDRTTKNGPVPEMYELANSFKDAKMWLTNLDSALYPQLTHKYNFAINMNSSKEQEEKMASKTNTKKERKNTRDMAAFELGLIMKNEENMPAINNRLGTDYASNMYLVNMRGTGIAYNNFTFNIGASFGVSTPKRAINDSIDVKFSKMLVYNNFGYNFNLGKYLVVAPYVGYGGAFADVNYTFQKFLQDSFSFTKTEISKTYTNYAFIFNSGLNLKIFPSEEFYITAEANYTADISNKSWMFRKKRPVTDFPNYSHSGMYYTFGVGLNVN